MDATSLVSAWEALTLQLAFTFSEQTARTWQQIVLGWVLPAVFALYRKRDDCDADHPFATHAQLAGQMIRQVRSALPGVRIRVAADGAYATRQMVAGLPPGVSDRWGVEECIFEAKQQLGFEDTRGWCSATVNHQAPLAMVLVSLVKAWFAKAALDEPGLLPEAPPWNQAKTRPSFADMIAAPRRVLWLHRISSISTLTGRAHGILKSITQALFAAA